MARHPLTFQVLAQCKTTKAKCSLMTLPHHVVETPVFMPVGKKEILLIFQLKKQTNKTKQKEK
jgi:queuine tRNA-ribosyltransferase